MYFFETKNIYSHKHSTYAGGQVIKRFSLGRFLETRLLFFCPKFYQKQSPRGVQACNFIEKKDFGTGVLLWILRSFWDHFFLYSTSGGCFCFMAIENFVFQLEAFQFSKFHENVGKLGKGNFKRGLTMTFNSKISKITGKMA